MKTTWKIPRFGRLSVPVALLLVCLIAYFPMIYRLGFYWDDWPSIWFLHLWGAAGFREGFASDRPLLAWVFMLTTPIFGESAAAWQIFSIFTRWITSLAWWWSLWGLFPKYPRQAFWAAVLFAVYPGFSQQYIAVTYSNAYLVYFLFVISFGSMIWAHRSRRWFFPLMGVSLVASAFSMFITEYFFGLELLRPFLLWFVLEDRNLSTRERLRQVILHWAPYLAILVPFLGWRAFIAPSPRAQIILFGAFIAAPVQTILNLTRTILQDFWEVNFMAWVHGIDPAFLKDFDANVIALFIASVLASLVLTFFFLVRMKPEADSGAEEPATPTHLALSYIFLGIVAFLVSGWTIWITDLHFELLFPFDRFTLISMLGASLLISGLIGLAERKIWVSAVILALLVGISTGLQFQNRLYYRQEWLSQKNFFWQLAWRAPGLQPGTTVMTSEIPFLHYSDNSLTAPLNWIYAPDNPSRSMNYLLYDIEARLGEGLPDLQPGTPIVMPYRTASFQGSTSQAIVLFYDPPRCLKVMNPDLDRFLPVKPLYIREAAPLSRLDLILPDAGSPATPPVRIFGPEPPHTWCYFFEKAELFAQTNEWDQVVEMADEALKITKHFTDKNVSELIPFMMGYAHTGKWKKAVELSIQAFQSWDKTQYPLCDAWNSLRANTPDSEAKQAALSDIRQILSCTFP